MGEMQSRAPPRCTWAGEGGLAAFLEKWDMYGEPLIPLCYCESRNIGFSCLNPTLMPVLMGEQDTQETEKEAATGKKLRERGRVWSLQQRERESEQWAREMKSRRIHDLHE